MRWLPRSISGQLLALWILAMLVAHLIAVLLLAWWQENNTTIHPLSARTIEIRVVSAYRAASHIPGAATVLQDISLPESRFQLADTPLEDAPGMDAQEQALAQGIRHRLDLAPQVPVHVRLLEVDPRQLIQGSSKIPDWMDRALKGKHPWALDVDVSLPDGRWLRSQHVPTMIPAHWSRVLSFSLLVGMLPAAIIALVFGHRIMRPLRMLTEAAKRLSHGEQVILPSPRGPDGVREITQAFNAMQESLIRFVNGRTQMIAAIGHDLRTPLASLRIRAELIDDPDLRKAMVRTLNEMGVIVEETLQFARDDALQEPTQEVRIDTLAEEIAESQRMRGHVVVWFSQVDAGTSYRCRPVLLKRALNNLIDNAARYGDVQVTVRQDPSRQALRIEVEDQGPGIAPERLEQVFEPFARLDPARSQETGGVGLGLAIARTCIRAHGGDITLQNRAEGGLRAIVELPV